MQNVDNPESKSNTIQKRPLEGVKLLEFAAFINGAGAGYMLGDLGAEVIKIEEPVKGDPSRGATQLWDRQMFVENGLNLAFEAINRNKKSITLNLKKEKGKTILHKLVKNADVFYTNYASSVRKRLGLSYEDLCVYNPNIVYVVASGYGPEGEDSDKRAFDVLLQARSGLMYACGDRDSEEPYEIIGGVMDQTAATMTAYAILVGLISRDRHGIGQEINVSMLGTGIHMQALNVMTTLWRGRQMARHSRKRVRNPLTNHYQCSDGKWLALSEPQYDRFWENICEVFEIEEELINKYFATPEKRRDNYTILIEILEKLINSKPRNYWIGFLKNKAKFGYDVVNDMNEVVNDPQVLANEYVTTMNHDVMGKVKVAGSPISFSKMIAGPQRKAPELGEHTEEILLEIGYTWEDIESLQNGEVI